MVTSQWRGAAGYALLALAVVPVLLMPPFSTEGTCATAKGASAIIAPKMQFLRVMRQFYRDFPPSRGVLETLPGLESVLRMGTAL